jgi:hypothetical protein
MIFDTIHGYGDFCAMLLKAGFSIGGDNGEGIFTLSDYFGSNIHWHTDDKETDPWAWRMRVLTEESCIGYGKLFFQKGGYMTAEWSPFFITAKRNHQTYEDMYRNGLMSLLERTICKYVEGRGEAALHEIKAAVGAKGLEAALAKLQTGMFLTISGQTMRLSKENVPYGWPATTFRLADDFWGMDVMEKANALSAKEARERIIQHVHELNPNVEPKALERFLR